MTKYLSGVGEWNFFLVFVMFSHSLTPDRYYKNKKETNMNKILIALVVIASIILIGCAGELDHHRYIEVNSTKQTRMPFYYEN